MIFEVLGMLQIAICDDEVTNILKVKELAELFFRTHCVEIRIEIYKSSDNLLYDMQDGQYFDLCLLDIEMPEVSAAPSGVGGRHSPVPRGQR